MRLFFEILFRSVYHSLRTEAAREFLLLALKYGNTGRYTRRKINAAGKQFDVPDALSFIWQFHDIFVEENYKFESGFPNPVIIDCGANVGLSCVYFKKLFPNAVVTAFEADPKIFEFLKENLSANKITGVEIFNKAVWINNTEIEIGTEGADGASVLSGSDNRITVKAIRLKEVLEKSDRIDMLKIDIEGAEYEVIKDCGNSLSNVRNIFIEYHSFLQTEQNLNEILTTLTSAGFRYFIRPAADRLVPFINRKNKNAPAMDLQLNIYAYKNENNSRM